MGVVFEHSVRVPYAHVDRMDIVYYANYFIYFEMARGELLRESKMPCAELEERGIFLPVVQCGCHYRKSGRYDELLKIQSRCSVIRKTRLRIDCSIFRDNELLVEGYTIHACIDNTGRVRRLPDELLKLAE